MRELRVSPNATKESINLYARNHEKYILDMRHPTNVNRVIYTPSWNDFTALVFRPLPVPTNNGLSEFIENPTDKYNPFGDWLGNKFVVARIGNESKSATFLVKHRNESQEVMKSSPAYRLREFLEPYFYVKRNLHSQKGKERAEKTLATLDKTVWKFVKDDNQTFVRLDEITFIQALVYVNKSKQIHPPAGVEDGQSIPLVMLTKSAETAIFREVRPKTPDEGWKDLIDVNNGYLVRIVRDGADTSEWYPDETTANKNGLNMYVADLHTKYDGKPAALGKLFEKIRPKLVPWAEDTQTIFLLPDEKEQLQFICDTDIPAIYLFLVFGEDDVLPKRVIARAKETLARLSNVYPVKTVPSKQETVVEEYKEETGNAETSVEAESLDESLFGEIDRLMEKHFKQ